MLTIHVCARPFHQPLCPPGISSHANRSLDVLCGVSSASMRASAWRPKTSCKVQPLLPASTRTMHFQMASYWRRPQGVVDSPQRPGFENHQRPSFEFHTEGGFCEGARGSTGWSADEGAVNAVRRITDFGEPCKAHDCAPPLVESLSCGPVPTG